MKNSLRLVVLFMISAAVVIPQIVKAETLEYCVDNNESPGDWVTCYATLQEAEADIRSDSFGGGAEVFLEYFGPSILSTDGSTVREYFVRRQGPSEYGEAEFYSVSVPGSCTTAAGLYAPHKCADEAGVLADIMSHHPAPDYVLRGGYGPPIEDSPIDASGNGSGTLHFESTREAYSASENVAYPISKKMEFNCADGFTHLPLLGEYFETRWPDRMCRTMLTRLIRVQAKQVASCPANANPCYPATGDKARFEKDFEFAGWDFVRNYHSLLEVSGFAPGWTHTFSERLVKSGNNFMYLTERGYVEIFRFSSSGSVAYAMSNSGLILRRVPNSSTADLTLHSTDGIRRVFAANGRLKSVTDVRSPDRTVTAAYGSDGLSTLTDIRGRSVTFGYSGFRLTSITLPDGNEISYTYDDHGNLVGVAYPDGTLRTYHYGEAGLADEKPNHLTGITSENGQRYASFSYDDEGRVTSSQLHLESGFAAETIISYPGELTASVQDANGAIDIREMASIRHRRVASIESLRGSQSFEYNENERIASHTDAEGVVTEYEYYSGNELIAVTRGAGTPDAVRTTYEWNSNYQITSSTTSILEASVWKPQQKFAYVYYTDGSIKAVCAHDRTSYDASSYGCHNSSQPPLGVQKTLFIYCSSTDAVAPGSTCPIVGLLKQVDGPRTDVSDITTYEYRGADDLSGCGASGPCHRKGDLWKVTNPLGQVTEIAHYDGAGRPTRIVDENGVVIDLQFNQRGWLIASVIRGNDDNSETDDAATSFEYSNVGLVEKITQPDGTWVVFEYDGAQRLIKVEDALGNTVSYTLDGAGNRIEESIADSASMLRHSLSRIFDQLGQLETVADADSTPTDLTYDSAGNIDSVTDPLGRVTKLDHDPLGRLKQSIANVTGSGNERAVTGFEYDALSRLTAVIDPKGLTTSYTYDGLDNLVALDSPDTGTATFNHDSAGNVIGKLDARGVQTDYAYDAAGRLVLADVPTVGEDVALTYDVSPAACLAGETFAAGRLARITDYSGTTDYCHDHRGNVVRKVQALAGGPTNAVAYGYDLADRLAVLTYPSGAKVTYQRDAAGRITGVQVKRTPTTAVETLVSATAYEPFGPLSQLTFGNGRVLSKAYDQNYGIDSVSDSTPDGLSLDFTLDDAGNVIGIEERLATGANASRTIDYDGLDRLTSLSEGFTSVQSFDYDATGNRLSKATTSTVNYTYPVDSHRLMKVGSQNRVYDDAGNSISLHTKHFTYDDHGRMRQFISGSTLRNEYRFNGRGERVGKINITSPGSTRYFVYDEAGRLLGEYKSSGAAVKEYVWLDDTLVAVLGSYQGHRFQYVLTDHLGTPRAVVNPPTDRIIWRWDLTPSAFGEHGVQANPDGDGANYALNLRYPGQYYDGESKLHYNYFRDYDPATGRYVQSDPIGLAGGLSTYGYVGGNALRHSDPLGLAIYLQFHDVVPSFRAPANRSFVTFPAASHGKIVIYPENLDYWRAQHPGLFPNGRNFMTVGGGPDSDRGLFGPLRGGLNRYHDLNDGWTECIELDRMHGLSEDEVIRQLISGVSRFNRNSTQSYSLMPSADGYDYNSNGFIHGIGVSSGLRMPFPSQIRSVAPGYGKPVPIGFFR